MKEIKVATRYAKALFDLALEKNILEQVFKDAGLIYDICESNRDFILFLRSPVIKENKKVTVLKNVFEKSIHELTLRFLLIITKNRREAIIQDIAEMFLELFREYKNIIKATVTTAVPIDKEIRDRMVKIMEEQTKASIELKEKVDESIIGGFIMHFDDKQYDASILRQIQNLEKEFDVNLYIKGF
ncbi:MAG: ATP synthase F1 subunit delta [Bacteroidales bacterium]|nr:ATP synthase F1 subunit delta [Bacteroidales bacterium]